MKVVGIPQCNGECLRGTIDIVELGKSVPVVYVHEAEYNRSGHSARVKFTGIKKDNETWGIEI